MLLTGVGEDAATDGEGVGYRRRRGSPQSVVEWVVRVYGDRTRERGQPAGPVRDHSGAGERKSPSATGHGGLLVLVLFAITAGRRGSRRRRPDTGVLALFVITAGQERKSLADTGF